MEGSCSVRMVQPFWRYASTRPVLADLAPPELAAMDLDARLPLRATHDALLLGSERLGDPTLGLEMGRSLCFGSGGVFDYAVRSAPTVRESLAVAARFSSLIAAPFLVSLESRGRQSFIRLDDEIPWAKATADFALSAWYRTHAADELPRAAHPEVWIPYAMPANTAAHERAFPGATLKFDAPFLGFAFDRHYEDAPMPVADPELHTLLCARADALLSQLSQAQPMTLAVRRMIGQEIREGKMPTVEGVARKVHMSHRSVSRRLEREGTSFARELDTSRRELALALGRQPGLSIQDVSYRLGFSHSESFFRAFKRWTGGTPVSFRASDEAPSGHESA
jgi:AraC-like DNA-binding protein